MDTKQLTEPARVKALIAELDWCIANGHAGPRTAQAVETARAALAALSSDVTQAPTMPVELLNVEDELKRGEGFWRSCSGCHETEDGHPVGHYEFSTVLNCDLGSGCSECGGIGAVWDNLDYDAMAAAGDADEIAREQADVAKAPDAKTIERLFIKHGGPVDGGGWCLNKSGLDDFLRDLYAAPVAAQAPGNAEFLAGICVALQAITERDQGVLWAEIVRACGIDKLVNYATHVEPDEWELAGFSKYAISELGAQKPESHAAAHTTLSAAAPASPPDFDELRRAMCVIGVVGQIDGHDVIRRGSVLDIIEQRKLLSATSQAPVADAARGEPMADSRVVCWAVPNKDGSAPTFGKGWMFSPVKQGNATMALVIAPAQQPARASEAGEVPEWRARAQQILNHFDAATAEPMTALANYGERALTLLRAMLAASAQQAVTLPDFTYATKQATNCAKCGDQRHTPLRIDWMGGYVCLTCIDKELEARDPETQQAVTLTDAARDAKPEGDQ